MNKKLIVTIKDVKNVDCRYPDTKIYIEENLNLNSFLISVMTSLLYLCLSTFFIVFPKTALFINLKTPFFLRSLLISVYGLYQYMVYMVLLNLITTRTFLKS